MNEHVLKPDGAVFLLLVRGKISPESWVHLSSIAKWSDEKTLFVYVKNFAMAKAS